MSDRSYESLPVKKDVAKEVRDLRRDVQAERGRDFSFSEFIALLVSSYRQINGASHE